MTAAVGKGLGVFDDGVAIRGGQLLDDAEAAPYANVERHLDFLSGGTPAKELIGGHAKGLGELVKDMGRRAFGLAFVVRDHAAGDADVLGKLGLREATGLAQACHALAEGLGVLDGSGHGTSKDLDDQV